MPKKRVLESIAFAVLIALTSPNAIGSMVLPDGVLASDPNNSSPSFGFGTFTAIDPSLDLSGGGLRFTGTFTPSNPFPAYDDYGFGLTIGNRWFIIHPGFSGGAFRPNTVDLNTNFEQLPPEGLGNTNMGFTPVGAETQVVIDVTDAGGGFYDVDATVTQAGNVSNLPTLSLIASSFGPGGAIETFGVRHNRFLATAPVTTLAYSGVGVARIPEPASAVTVGSIAALAFGASSRRRLIVAV